MLVKLKEVLTIGVNKRERERKGERERGKKNIFKGIVNERSS